MDLRPIFSNSLYPTRKRKKRPNPIPRLFDATFVALTLQDMLMAHATGPITGLFSLPSLLQNPILAAGYLLMPHIFMITLDIRARKKQQETQQLTQPEPTSTPTSTATPAPNEEPKTEESAQKRREETVAAT